MVTVEQVKAARMLLRWDQTRLAEAATVGVATIKRIEAKPGPLTGNARTAYAIEKALTDAGVVFLDEAGLGVLLRAQRSA